MRKMNRVMKMNKIIAKMQWDVETYRNHKIINGYGLQDDPEWVVRFEDIINEYKNDDYDQW